MWAHIFKQILEHKGSELTERILKWVKALSWKGSLYVGVFSGKVIIEVRHGGDGWWNDERDELFTFLQIVSNFTWELIGLFWNELGLGHDIWLECRRVDS